MHEDIDHILVTPEQIADRVHEMAAQIEEDLGDIATEITLVPVLTGSIFFLADLARCLTHKIRIGVVTVNSYPGKSLSSQGAVIDGILPDNIEGRHVLIVDDILDSGGTLRLLRESIARQSPASIAGCVLLRKSIPSAIETPCEYIGFDIPNEFVVGYGLDYDDYYRNLPYIGTLRRDIFS
ncbi:MAG: hypoxanthine phosphoribosyltransferase [Phycisphaerae bacterium]|nr:hypoxanthine phosphoribosyltransferase [Phycisphaerae bacterium]